MAFRKLDVALAEDWEGRGQVREAGRKGLLDSREEGMDL